MVGTYQLWNLSAGNLTSVFDLCRDGIQNIVQARVSTRCTTSRGYLLGRAILGSRRYIFGLAFRDRAIEVWVDIERDWCEVLGKFIGSGAGV